MYAPFTVPFPPIGGPSLYVVYVNQYLREHADGIADVGTWRPFHVGMCFFDQLLSPPDALANAQWLEIAERNPTVITQAVFFTTDRAEAEARRAAMIAADRYPANEFARPVDGRISGRVRCCEDGVIYKNAAAAALAAGCTASQMSNHLKRNPSFNRVRGKTYERVL